MEKLDRYYRETRQPLQRNQTATIEKLDNYYRETRQIVQRKLDSHYRETRQLLQINQTAIIQKLDSYYRATEICVKNSNFEMFLASRSQTKPEISPKIGAKSKASTIRSQPYITLPYLVKKIGTSVDVKVDLKKRDREKGKRNGTRNGTERNGGDQAQFFTRIPSVCLNSKFP